MFTRALALAAICGLASATYSEAEAEQWKMKVGSGRSPSKFSRFTMKRRAPTPVKKPTTSFRTATTRTTPTRTATPIRKTTPTKTTTPTRTTATRTTTPIKKAPTLAKKPTTVAKKPVAKAPVKKTTTTKKPILKKGSTELLGLLQKTVKTAQKYVDKELKQHLVQNQALYYIISTVDMIANEAASVNTPIIKIHRHIKRLELELAAIDVKVNARTGSLTHSVMDYSESV